MGHLGADSAVDGARGRYTATLHEDWSIWGPMGGYVASIALRAATGEVADGLVPASLTCQFLSTGHFGSVDVEATVRRSSRRAALIESRLSQDGNAVLDAQVWFTAPASLIEHDHAPRHRHGRPDDHAPFPADAPASPFPAWRNFERRPLDWIEDWEAFEGSAPEWAEWLRFLSGPFDDPVLEACRLLVLADLPSFPAAIRAHPRTRDTWVSPSLDLATQFHHVDDLGDWLLVQGVTPIAHRGLIGFRSEVWTAGGRLAASGSGQLICRSTVRQ